MLAHADAVALLAHGVDGAEDLVEVRDGRTGARECTGNRAVLKAQVSACCMSRYLGGYRQAAGGAGVMSSFGIV